jgi:hypothetical protein
MRRFQFRDIVQQNSDKCNCSLLKIGREIRGMGSGGDPMRVTINRNTCPAHLAFCERCLGRFLLYPEGYERRCFEELVEDGSPDLTILLHTGDNYVEFVLNEEQRRLIAGEGWAGFVDVPVPMYRNKRIAS